MNDLLVSQFKSALFSWYSEIVSLMTSLLEDKGRRIRESLGCLDLMKLSFL